MYITLIYITYINCISIIILKNVEDYKILLQNAIKA